MDPFFLGHVYIVGSGPVLSRSCTVRVYIVGSGPVLSRSCTVRVYIVGSGPVLFLDTHTGLA